MNSDLKELQKGVTEAGFRPAPFGFLLWNLRRFLWPFIRQYHFFQLEQLVQMRVEVASQMGAEIASLTRQQAEVASQMRAEIVSFTRQQSELIEELSKLTIAHAQVGTDVAALVNRQGRDISDIDTLRNDFVGIDVRHQESTDALAKLNQSFAELGSEVAAIASRHVDWVDKIQAHIQDEKAQRQAQTPEESQSKAQLEALVHDIDARTKLFLASTSNGLFLVKAGDLISDSLASKGCWDCHIGNVVKDVARQRDGLAVDVGAHLGYLSAVMGNHFRRVISFEPNRFTYTLLVANMAINRLAHVECVNGALFSRTSRLSLARSEEQEIPLSLKGSGDFDGLGSQNLGAYVFTEHGTDILAIEARTLDSYGLQDVAFIKIDAQGADGEVIIGALDTIRRCQPVIVFEWEQHLSKRFGRSLETVIEILGHEGYVVNILKQTNEKQTDYIARTRSSVSGYQS